MHGYYTLRQRMTSPKCNYVKVNAYCFFSGVILAYRLHIEFGL